MANLSNINNKFLVTTGGNVLIGQTSAVGSSILQITGASSPLAIHTPSGNNGLEFIIDNGLYKNWQIGVQNQVGNALTIVPSTAAGNTTFSTPVATFLTSGNVGIGTGTPGAKLDIKGSGNTAINTKGNLFVSSGGTAAQAAETGGQISFGSWLNGDLSQPYPLAAIRGVAESSTTNNNRGALIFGTMDSNTAVQERMRIESGGNVRVNFNQSGSAGNVYFQDVTNGASMFYIQPAVYKGSAPYNTNYINAANNSNIGFIAGGSERIRINSSGNVGIGTDSPDSKLHVKGISTLEETTAGAGTQLKFVGQDNSGQFNFLIGKQYNVNNAFEITPSTVANGGVFTNPAFLVNSAGNVGIGTTAPSTGIEIGNGGLGLPATTGTDNSISFMRLKKSTSGWGVDYGLNTIGTPAGWIQARDTTNFAINAALLLQPNGGNVGIGTASPYSSLSVIDNNSYGYFTSTSPYRTATFQGSGSTSIVVAANGNSNGVYSEIRLGNTHVTYGNYSPYVRATQGNGIDSYSLEFGTSSGGVASTAMYIGGATGTVKGNVGIRNTNPYSVLDVNGVITNRTASQDPNFTVAVVGMVTLDGGSLQFTQGFGGTSSAGDTVVFRYNAASWKSWSLDYTFASTNGLVKGTIGGYNNNGGGGTNFFLANQYGLNTPVATNSGQNVIVTFTGNFGIHMMCDMRYSQGGGDGAPRADRASLTYNS